MKQIIFVITFSTVVFSLSAAQEGTTSKSEPLIGSITELLSKHHIEITEVGLLQALQNDNSDVRWLAAEELAAEHNQNAIPALKVALHAEVDPDAQLNIAYALAQLGEESGTVAIRSACNDRGQSDGLRVRAIKYMADLKTGECIEAGLQLVASASPVSAEALSLLPRFSQASAKQHQLIEQVAQAALLSDDLMERRAATQVLARLKDVSALPALIDAMNRESDDTSRSLMKTAISMLQVAKK